MIVNLTAEEIELLVDAIRGANWTLPPAMAMIAKLEALKLHPQRPADFDTKVMDVLRQRNTSALTECECDFVCGAIAALRAIDPDSQPAPWWALAPISARPILEDCPEPRWFRQQVDEFKAEVLEMSEAELAEEVLDQQRRRAAQPKLSAMRRLCDQRLVVLGHELSSRQRSAR